MSITDLRSTIEALRAQASPDDIGVINALAHLLERFLDSDPIELIAAFDKIRPKKKKKSATKKTTPKSKASIATAVVDTYVAQLRSTMGNTAATLDLMKKIKGDKAVKKGEAIAIAQQIGVGVTSSTTKVQALAQIEGISRQLERDSAIAERIRRGA
jgi:hypothetical protein